MYINNIGNQILNTDWATLNINTQWIWNFKNGSTTYIQFDPLTTSSNRFKFYGTSTQYLYYNTSNEFGNFDTSTSLKKWYIDLSGNSNFLTINGVTNVGYQSRIKLDQRFINSAISSIDLIQQYIGVAHPDQSLDGASKYMFIRPDVGGDFGMFINNISGPILSSNFSTRTMTSNYNFSFNNSSSQSRVVISSNTTSGDIFSIKITGAGTPKYVFDTGGIFSYQPSTITPNTFTLTGSTGRFDTNDCVISRNTLIGDIPGFWSVRNDSGYPLNNDIGNSWICMLGLEK